LATGPGKPVSQCAGQDRDSPFDGIQAVPARQEQTTVTTVRTRPSRLAPRGAYT